jgi:hypothetical protein
MPLLERLDRRLTADEALKLQLPNFSFPEVAGRPYPRLNQQAFRKVDF